MVYLRRLNASYFRIFPEGRSFEFEGPGVTVLTGPNGLGKTSVFEAIEWALTGSILRLEELNDELSHGSQVSRYLARRSMTGLKDAFHVELEFGEASTENSQTFKREWVRKKPSGNDRFEPVSETTERVLDAQIREYLASADWGQVSGEFRFYLHDTHFLVQPTGGRWSTLSPVERWNRVSGPAGQTRLAELRKALGPKSSTLRVLRKKYDDCEREVEAKRRAVDEWDELKAELEAARLAAASAGTRTSDDYVRDLSELTNRARTLADGLVTLDTPSAPMTVDKGPLWLSRAIRSLAAALAHRHEALQNAMALPPKWRAASAAMRSASVGDPFIPRPIGEDRGDMIARLHRSPVPSAAPSRIWPTLALAA